MTTIVTDARRELEALAYRVRSFPAMSAEADLAEIAPHLTPAARDAAFGDLIDGIGLRDAACKACKADRADVATILGDPAIRHTAIRAAGTTFPFVLSSAKVVAAIARRDYDALDGLDRNLDGARAELANIKAGYFTSGDYGDADPEQLEELAEQKLMAALADFAFRQEHLLESRLVRFTVAAWRFADGARMRLMGGAR